MGTADDTDSLYAELVRRAREISLLASCSEVLHWDEETYMPPAGVAHRSQQRTVLAGIRHDKLTDPRLGEILSALESSPRPRAAESVEAVNIRELRKAYDRRRKLPRELLEDIVRTTALAQREWRLAYEESSFARFQPWLQRIVELKRQEAAALGREGDLYDALLDDYEPGARGQMLEQLFADLRAELVPILERLSHARRAPRAALLDRELPLDAQRRFARAVAERLGFDLAAGRIDETVHPFCAGIGPGDVRIAVRYSRDDLCQGLYSVIHEVGHAFYEHGLDPDLHGTPAAGPASLGIHESQSRLWENLVARGRGFWIHFLPLARETFGKALAGVSVESIHFAVNRVEPTFVRAEADEVTYNLHVVARFELERALINGDLDAGGVPAAWNELYRRYLGITPPSDRLGCLQDCHWANGLFGYFPTYTLGNLYAAQLFDAAWRELGDLEAQFARGDFRGLLEWLRLRVHRHGRRHEASRLIELATGESPGHAAFIRQLRRKYSGLYNVDLP